MFSTKYFVKNSKAIFETSVQNFESNFVGKSSGGLFIDCSRKKTIMPNFYVAKALSRLKEHHVYGYKYILVVNANVWMRGVFAKTSLFDVWKSSKHVSGQWQ